MSALLSALGTCSINAAADLEHLGCLAFLIGGVARAVARKMKYLPRPEIRRRASVLADGHARGRFPSRPRLFEYKKVGARNTTVPRRELEPGVLYIPDTRLFPVLDAFYVAEVQRAAAAKKESGQASDTPTGGQSSAERVITFIGLQVTRQDTHNTTASKMASFMEYMTLNFNNWEVMSEAMEWEIIYIQHADSTPMTGRQQCTFTGQRSSDPQAPENFWERKVDQYQVQLDAEIAQLLIAAVS
ncbi:RHS2a, partial [Trypanosoma conorhini]